MQLSVRPNPKADIYWLDFLGWTQTETAGKVGLKQSQVSSIIGNTNFSKINNDINSGKPIPDVAQFHGLARPRELDKRKEWVALRAVSTAFDALPASLAST